MNTDYSIGNFSAMVGDESLNNCSYLACDSSQDFLSNLFALSPSDAINNVEQIVTDNCYNECNNLAKNSEQDFVDGLIELYSLDKTDIITSLEMGSDLNKYVDSGDNNSEHGLLNELDSLSELDGIVASLDGTDTSEVVSSNHESVNLAKQRHGVKRKFTDTEGEKNFEQSYPGIEVCSKEEKSVSIKYPIYCDLYNVSPIGLYRFIIENIVINADDFKKALAEELKESFPLDECLSDEELLHPEITITCDRVKNYISKIFDPIITEIEAELKLIIKPYANMPTEYFKIPYMSGGILFSKLLKFCIETSKNVKNCDHIELVNLIQSSVRVELRKKSRTVFLQNSKKHSLVSHIISLLENNILSIPEKVLSKVDSLPLPSFTAEFFGLFENVYLDNRLLIKARELFRLTQEKIISDSMLGDHLNHDPKKVESFKESRKYLRELIKNQMDNFNKNLTDPIMIVNNDRVSTANTKTRSAIMSKIRSDLMSASMKLYASSNHESVSLTKQHHGVNRKFIDTEDKKNFEQSYKGIEICPKEEKSVSIKYPIYCDLYNISPIGLYRFIIRNIVIDTDDFKKSLAEELKGSSSLAKCLSDEGLLNPEITITCDRVKNYISKMFDPLITEIENELKLIIKPHEGMSAENFKMPYMSDGILFSKLLKFCNETSKNVKNCNHIELANLIQSNIRVESRKKSRTIFLQNSKKHSLVSHIIGLLESNILSIPRKVSSKIDSLPLPSFTAEFFGLFENIYLDNRLLIKVRELFRLTQEKIVNDPLLGEHLKHDPKKVEVVGENKKYLRKLIESQMDDFNKNLEPIMVVNNDRVSVADTKTRGTIVSKIRSDLMLASTKLYKKLYVK